MRIRSENVRMVGKLVVVTAGMFAFGYALIPIYKHICEATGINAQDFAVVRSMVFIGSVLYIVGLILTDISYTLVDPRIRFE